MSGQYRSSSVHLDRSVVLFPPKESRLKQGSSKQVSVTASSLLAAGQVSPDQLLLTLIDPWSFFQKRLDSNKALRDKFLPLLLHVLLRFRSVQISF